MQRDPAELIEQVVRQDGRYPLDAYAFLEAALAHAAHKIHGDRGAPGERHVSGQQLCESVRELAIRHWGRLARDVLARWDIRQTRDIGEMVFLLVNNGLLTRQESDRIEDFDNVYDFDEAFGRYAISLD